MPTDAQYDPYSGVETPEDIAAQKAALFQQQLRGAQPQNSGAMFGAQTAGMLAGQGISDFASTFAPSQRQQQAQQNQQIMQQAPQDPDQLEAYASKVQQQSPQLAAAFINRANQLRASKASLLESASKLQNDEAQRAWYMAQAKKAGEYVPTEHNQHLPGGVTWNKDTDEFSRNGKQISADQADMFAAAAKGKQTYAETKARFDAQYASIPQDSIEYGVAYYRTFGTFPPNFRSDASKAKLFSAIASDAASRGDTNEASATQARARAAGKPALEQNTKMYSSLVPFVNTMHDIINDTDALAQQQGGPAFMNKVFNAWKRGGSTDPETNKWIAKFDVWNTSIVQEMAKVASGTTGSVRAATDKQNEKWEAKLNSANNYNSWRAAADAITQEAGHRTDELQASINDLNSIPGVGNSPPIPKTNTVPQQDVTQIKEALARRGVANPTADQIQQIYQAAQKK